MIRTPWPVVLVCALAACGGDPPGEPNPVEDTGRDAVADAPTDSTTVDATEDPAPGDVLDRDLPDIDGLPIPFSQYLGPCTREVRVGSEGLLLYSFVYDYSDAPATVTATRSTGGELDVVINYFDVETRRQCAKPPEERHAAFVDLIGCPTRIIVDTDDNGLISPLDLAVNYTYDEEGNIAASDRFDWRNNFTGSAWFFDYNADGALIGGHRLDATQVGELLHVSYPGELQMLFEYDDEADGSIDSRITYEFNAEGHAVETAVEEADPATGELSFRSRSTYTYDCWE